MIKGIKEIKQYDVKDIHVRDSFIFTDRENERYLLFGTNDVSNGAADLNPFFEVYTSKDLKTFEGPYVAFYPKKGFWGVRHYWAPEVHEYKGKYYMFASFKGGIDEDRGTAILVSDRPEGPYEEHSKGHVTLKGHECLDGTLYIDKKGKPWIVFIHEWTEMYYGKIKALPLSDDLTHPLTQDALTIFDLEFDRPGWIRTISDDRAGKSGYLTDAPFMHRMENGDLIMLWSSYSVENYKNSGGKGGYVVAMVKSESGDIQGPWKHAEMPVFDINYGHVALFRNLDGELMLSGHGDDTHHGSEHSLFFKVKEENGTLVKVD